MSKFTSERKIVSLLHPGLNPTRIPETMGRNRQNQYEEREDQLSNTHHSGKIVLFNTTELVDSNR